MVKEVNAKLGVVARALEPITIHFDNMAVLAYAKDPKYHRNTKHIDMQYYFIRDMVAQKEVVLKHISTSRMVTDPLTKPIACEAYQPYVRSLGLCRL